MGGFLALNIIWQWKIINLITGTLHTRVHLCVDCVVSSYELVLGYMILYTVAVRM